MSSTSVGGPSATVGGTSATSGGTSATIDPRLRTLYASLDDFVDAYPAHAVERMNAFLFGTAFFPAGSGLVPPRPTLPDAPIAIVAHVFDASSFAFARGLGNGNEATGRNRTWRGLTALLERVDIPLERCWLTNAMMGVKLGNACGDVAAGSAYRARCAAFLRLQIETVRPLAIATLGTQAMRVLRSASTDLSERWPNVKTFRDLDRAEPPRSIEKDVRFGTHTVARVVALSHTCSWTSRRTYRGETGLRADDLLLRDALGGVVGD